MRKAMCILAAGLLACASIVIAGDVDREVLTVTSTLADKDALVTNSTTKVRGEIREIMIDLTTATTADVSVVISPELSTMSDINLYTANGITADVVVEPAKVPNLSDGTATSTNAVVPYVVVGETIRLICENFSSTGQVVKAVIKYEKR